MALCVQIHARWLVMMAPVVATLASGCVAPLGPGYTIEKQQVRVQFVAAPEPRIRMEAEYSLKNTGNRPINELELRLPGRRRFHFEQPQATWDETVVATGISTEHPRNALITLPEPWTTSARHTLHLSIEYLPATASETALSFSSEAFFLPAEGRSEEHTSELQSPDHLVCRLLLEKKKKINHVDTK